jgi:xanthine dehydrogenase YagS FAD-binding subunit
LLFELPSFEHIDAKTVEEAVFYLHKYGDEARVSAGDTDLLALMKDKIAGPKLKIPKVLINIKNIPEMNRIIYGKKGNLRIGAAVTLRALEECEFIKEKFNILQQAASQVACTQIRNMGTLGGNLCQRPRCMYFRHPFFVCYKKGGTMCYAISGEHRFYHSIMKYGKCVMAHPSDLATVLVALKAKAKIASYEGERYVSLQNFFRGPDSLTETILEPYELLTEVIVPNNEGRTHQLFLKSRIRHSTDFALSSVAVISRISNEICEDISIVLGGVAPFPYVAYEAEEILRKQRIDENLILQAVEASLRWARPLPMNEYKVNLTKALLKRALTSILLRQHTNLNQN